ncbi:Ig-like domain-containing protein [Stigmatella sp. ncwal1]|uniref:Ig-like domain-containing protein n=1 Tax=Stigmatella ashevillensis TaxID=2995309 RepID=A0ABT5DF21_9BACT|nr:RHS repeat-associated core domain-containing protein [Stigmatella ashevillena]MDC0712256.1 Ig-like domain-containing protein [Stigmatella ashevillena]
MSRYPRTRGWAALLMVVLAAGCERDPEGPTEPPETQPPSVTIEGVSEGQVSREPLVPTWRVESSGPATVEAALDGVPFVSGTPVRAEGAHALVVVAKDPAGKEGRARVGFAIDTTAPRITLSGVDEAERRNTPVVLGFRVEEEHPGTVEATLNGTPVASGATVSAEGAHEWVVVATDAVGNRAEARRHFKVDMTPPTLTVLSPEPGLATQEGTVEVVVTAVDDEPVAGVWLGAAELTRGADGNHRGTVALEEGSNLLTLLARDVAGNTAQRTLVVTRDSTPPQLTLTSPSEGAKVAGDSVQVEGRVEDASAPTVRVAGLAAAVGADGRFQLTMAVAQGPVSLEVVATDAAGNTTRLTRAFRANTTPPRLDVTSPASGTVTEEPSIEVSGFARASDRTDTVKLEVAGGEHGVGPDGRFSVDVPLVPGPNTVSVTAVDGYGLRTVRTVRVERLGSPDAGTGDGGSETPDAGPPPTDAGPPPEDGGTGDEPPVLVLASPQEDSLWGTERVAVLGRVEEGTLPLEVTVDGLPVAMTGRQFSASLALPEGSSMLLVRAVDALGRTAEVRRQVRVDQTPPFLEVTRPEQPVTVVTESPYLVEGLAGDAYLGGVTVNDAPALVLAGRFSASVPLVLGNNAIVVTAVDLAGNRSQETRTLRVEGMPPKLRVLEPAEGSEARTPVVRVTMSVEASAPLAEVRIGTGLATQAGTGQYTAQVPLALGENVIPLMARDTLGMTGTASVRVRYRDVRTEPLTVTGVDPPDQAEGVEPDTLVNVAFNKPVKPASVQEHFTVNAGGQPLPGGWSVAPGGQTVSFIARDALPESASLQVSVVGVEPVDGPGMEQEFHSVFTVRRPLTRLRGHVANEYREPLPGVRVEVEGQGLSTHTGSDGSWALFGATPGQVVLRYEGGASSTGNAYPTVRRSFAVEAERDNLETPLRLVPVDAASAESVDAAGPVHLTFGGRHGALALDIPAGGLIFADGSTRGVVTATELPAIDRPVPSDGPVGPARLWQLHPAGTHVMAPVEMRLPNRDKAPPGHQALLFTYDPSKHQMHAVGVATVGVDGTQFVSDEPVQAGSLEFFGYLPLPEETSAALAHASSPPSTLPGPLSSSSRQGLFGLGFPWGLLSVTPSMVLVTGNVRGPREQAVAITIEQPALVQNQPVTLDSASSYRLPISFQGRTLVQLPPGQQKPLSARVSAVGPQGVVLGPPSGSPWFQESPTGAQVELSTEVELKPGITQITLTANTDRGRDTVRLDAELFPDPEEPTDGGTAWLLRVLRVSSPSPEELEGQGVVRFSGMPVMLESTWGQGFSMSGAAGRYVAAVPHLQGYFLPPSFVRVCVNLPAWPRVQAWTDASGRVQTRVFTNAQIPECSATHEVWYTQESLGPVDVYIDARYLHGSLTFVDRQGQKLPAACESERDPETGKVLGLSPDDVRTTEVHFFLEHDLSQPIATFTVAHPFECEETPPSGAQGRYARLRMGPSALRWLGSAVPDSLRRNSTRLLPGDRLVVFALNHATGYAGMGNVTVPPVSRSTRNEDGSCPADEAEGGPIIVKEGTESIPVSRCTLEDLGIRADIQLYPPEIDVRVDRRAQTEGVVQKNMEPSLVRHGGAATTRDDFVRVATDWRVRRAPAPAMQNPEPLPPADPSCDGGVRPDGGFCGPQQLLDEGRKGWVLERYCSEFTPPLTPEQEQACLEDDSTLASVPPGVPPIAGRVVRITGSAVEEPAVATFKISPGRSSSTVQTSMRMVGQDGKAVVLNNLPRANHYVQVVGHSVFPRDRDQDGVIQPSEENAPPPDFSDGEGEPGLPKGAVELKNVYRSLEADGGPKVERYDRAREHEFRVLEVGSAQVSAQTDRGETRPLPKPGEPSSSAAANPGDVAYKFLLHLLEPTDDGRAGTLSGDYALRLGGDSFGIECPIALDVATKTLRGTCEGEYLPEVLSANDILYLEVYLRGNAENVLYRFNFNGLSMREDYVGAASMFTAERAVEEQSGKPVLDRPISQLNEAHFFLGPQRLTRGRIRLCTNKDCSGHNALIKEAFLNWTAEGKYSVQEQEGGRATASLVQEETPGAGGARHFRLALPASLTRMPGSEGGANSSGIHLVMNAELPRPEDSDERLGDPRGRFQGLHAEAPGQQSVAGIGLADLHLAFTHTDFSVPQYAEAVSFSRTYDNQNDLPSPLGVGWRHDHDGFVLEEKLGRYVVVLRSQAWGFDKCNQVNVEAQTASQCLTDKTHGMELEVTNLGVRVTTEYGHVYRFDQPAVKRNKEGRRKWLLTKFHDGHGRGESEGWTHLTYANNSNRLKKVERTPGVLTLEFKYCEDFSQDACDGVPPDAAGTLKALARSEDFKLLKGVVLLNGGTQLHAVRFKHDKWGNLLEAERTTDPPPQRWQYTYPEVPVNIEGSKAWRAVNELSEARFEVEGQTQWRATYERGGAECYKHLESFECVTGVQQTGSMGKPLKVQGSPSERTVSLPVGALARMGLNPYGNPTSLRVGGTPAQTMSWSSSTREGKVWLEASTSPAGRTLKYVADNRMRTKGIQVPGASDVAGLNGDLVTVTSRTPQGHPAEGTISTGTGATSWSMPHSTAGDMTGLSLSSGGNTTTLFSRTPDLEGRISSETDALGNTTTYSFEGGLGLPTSATVTAADAQNALADYNLTMEYDSFGRLTHRRNEATGSEETWSYDGQGNVLRHARSGQPSEIWTYTYTYGDQKLTVTEHLQGVAYTRTAVFQEGLLISETLNYGNGTATRTYAYEGGRLNEKTDERGIVWAYAYDDAGRLTKITANGNLSESYDLDAEGNVKILTDREGRKLQIGYDALGQPISWLYEDGHLEQVKRDAQGAIVWHKSQSSDVSSSHIFDQQVDALGRVLSTRSAGGSAGGVDVQATYDAAGRVLTREDLKQGLRESFEYKDALGRLTRHTRIVKSKTETLNWEEVRQYADSGERTQVEVQRTIDTGNDSQRTETQTLVFDVLGRLLVDERPGAGKTDYVYDARGNVLTRQHSVLGTTTYAYDGLGNLRSKAEPGGILTTYTTDAAGLVLSQQGPHEQEQWTFSYDDFGRLTNRGIAAAGSTPAANWSFEYLGAGGVRETNPLEAKITRFFNSRELLLREEQGTRTTTYAYDGMWQRLRKVIEGNWELRQTREFDDLGRTLLTEELWQQGNHSYTYRTTAQWSGRNADQNEQWQSSDASRQERQSSVQVDSLGNVVSVTQGGLQDTWTYDAAGVLARESLAGRPVTRFVYEQDRLSQMEYGAETTHYAYDGAGRPQKETDPSGRARTLQYDAQGLVRQESFGSGEETLTTGYTYDQGGFLRGITRGGAQWTYTHGPRGELQAVTLPGELGSFTYQYDALLQLTGIAPPAGGSAPQTFSYDDFGRRTRRTRGTSVWVTTWQNGVGTTNDPNGDVVERVYDGRNRIALEQYRPGEQSQPHTDLTAVAYAYDGLDQLLTAKETRNSGAISNAYEYDARSRLISLKRGGDTVTYSYTDSGQKQSVTSPSGTVIYAYDTQDRVLSINSSQGPSVTVEWEPGGLLSKVSGNGVVEQYDHYAHGKIRSIVSVHNASPLTRYEYTYDDRGNRMEERYTGPADTSPEVTQYGYDQADRLTGVRYPSGESELYALGGDGSRREEKRVEGYLGSLGPDGLASATFPIQHWRYSYDTAGGLHRIDNVLTNSIEVMVITDSGGRVTTETRGNTERHYGWDAAGRLVSMTGMAQNQPLLNTYTYGFDGLQRTRAVGGEVRERYLWDEQERLLEQKAATPGTLTAYIGSKAIARGANRLTEDALGSIVGHTSASAQLRRYDSWGTVQENEVLEDWELTPAYAGQFLEKSSALSYARQRWYNSATGRFLSEDPEWGNLSQPTTLHPFLYANANPLAFIDPSGRIGISTDEGITGIDDDIETINGYAQEQLALSAEHFNNGAYLAASRNALGSGLFYLLQGSQTAASKPLIGLFNGAYLGSRGFIEGDYRKAARGALLYAESGASLNVGNSVKRYARETLSNAALERIVDTLGLPPEALWLAGLAQHKAGNTVSNAASGQSKKRKPDWKAIKEKGDRGEKLSHKQAKKNGLKVVCKQVHFIVKVPIGYNVHQNYIGPATKTQDVRVILDLLAITPDKQLIGIESKNGPKADFTKNQKIAYPWLMLHGGDMRSTKCIQTLKKKEKIDPRSEIFIQPDFWNK